MSLELYINNTFVELSDKSRIGLTLQANDIGDIQNKRANFTNQFKVPKTNSNNFLFGFCGNVSSQTNMPYQKATAKIIQDGIELVQNGYAIIDEAAENFSITVYSGNADLFELIKDKKLTELDLSAYDHVWNKTNAYANINSGTNEAGYVYALVDYGRMGSGNMRLNYTPPSIRVNKIIQLIIEGAGFNIAGGIYTDSDSILHSMILPYSRNEYNVDQATLDANLFSVGKLTDENVTLPTNTTGKITTAAHVTFDDETGAYFDTGGLQSDGTYFVGLSCFQTISVELQIDNTLNLPTGAATHSGSTIAIVTIEKVAASGITSVLKTETYYLSATNTINIATDNVHLNYGDLIRVTVIGKTDLLFFDGSGFEVDDEGTIDFVITDASFWSNSLDNNIIYGNTLIMSSLLPDMTQANFLKSILQFVGGQIQTNSADSTVYLEFFEKLKDNRPSKKDWSLKFTSGVDAVKFRAPYGQTNYLKYKKDESNLVDPEIGNGSFQIADNTLDLEKNVVQSLFAGTETGPVKDIGNINIYPPYVNKVDATTFMFTNKTEPRILLYEATTFADTIHYIGTSAVDGFGTDTFDLNKGFSAWFIDANNVRDFHLGFNNSLIADYYQTLINMLQQYKSVSAEIMLTTNDIGNYFDHLIPIYCDKHAADFYCYLIENYQKGKLTKCNLIRL